MNYNWYKAKFYIQTVNKAKKEGVKTRSYGYVIRVLPIPPDHTQGVYSWCANKKASQYALKSYLQSQKLGYWSCPSCDSNKQARNCCHWAEFDGVK